MTSVSVIIPAFNAAAFLEEAVASVWAQGLPGTEVIVADDGSTDGTVAVAERLAGEVTLVSLGENRGPAAARNRALSLARGELVAFLDADDLLPPQAFRVLLDGLREDPDAQVVKGRGRFRHLRERDWMEGDLSDFPHHLGGSLYRREIFSTVGGLDETLRYAEDSDWHHRAVEAGIRFRLVGKVTLMIRRHPGNMTLGLDARALGRLEVVRRALRRRRMGAAE